MNNFTVNNCSIIELDKHHDDMRGNVVTRNVPANELWYGNPAKFMRKLNERMEYTEIQEDSIIGGGKHLISQNQKGVILCIA